MYFPYFVAIYFTEFSRIVMETAVTRAETAATTAATATNAATSPTTAHAAAAAAADDALMASAAAMYVCNRVISDSEDE